MPLKDEESPTMTVQSQPRQVLTLTATRVSQNLYGSYPDGYKEKQPPRLSFGEPPKRRGLSYYGCSESTYTSSYLETTREIQQSIRVLTCRLQGKNSPRGSLEEPPRRIFTLTANFRATLQRMDVATYLKT